MGCCLRLQHILTAAVCCILVPIQSLKHMCMLECIGEKHICLLGARYVLFPCESPSKERNVPMCKVGFDWTPVYKLMGLGQGQYPIYTITAIPFPFQGAWYRQACLSTWTCRNVHNCLFWHVHLPWAMVSIYVYPFDWIPSFFLALSPTT